MLARLKFGLECHVGGEFARLDAVDAQNKFLCSISKSFLVHNSLQSVPSKHGQS